MPEAPVISMTTDALLKQHVALLELVLENQQLKQQLARQHEYIAQLEAFVPELSAEQAEAEAEAPEEY